MDTAEFCVGDLVERTSLNTARYPLYSRHRIVRVFGDLACIPGSSKDSYYWVNPEHWTKVSDE